MTLFLIPARAGSKRLFCGLPLWKWSLATAQRVILDPGDEIVVSTDDEDILREAGDFAELRPAELCTDESTTAELIDYYFKKNTCKAICLLQPTTPNRSDALVRWMCNRGDSCHTTSCGVANGACYVYIRDWYENMEGVETGFTPYDINTLEEFIEAEQDMLRKFQ